MITFKEVKVLDINSSYLGVLEATLMENAGKSVAEEIVHRLAKRYPFKKIAILCGTGNNGGDGFVTARYLPTEYKISVVLIKKEIKTELSKMNFRKLLKLKNINIIYEPQDIQQIISENDILVDGLLGVGVTGKIREPYVGWIQAMNISNKPIVSIDVPSGLGTEIAVRPTITVTFHDIKEGMTESNSGEIVVVDIGIPPDAQLYIGPGEFVYYPLPNPNSHKGENGRLLVIGGGPYTGAPALVALSAYRVGVDLVHIAVPKRIYPIVASYSPNFIVHPLSGEYVIVEDDCQILNQLLKNVDSVVIGPGMGTSPHTKNMIKEFLQICDKPMVIDADAIGKLDEKSPYPRVVIPHKGEFFKLTGISLPEDIDAKCSIVKDKAKALQLTILLKGNIDIISDGKRLKLNRTGNAGMTVGGTGDVLAGIVGGLLSKGVEPFNSATLGAFINGYAGDLAYLEKHFGLMATDVIDKIPTVLSKFVFEWKNN